jgi:hypothetical protein
VLGRAIVHDSAAAGQAASRMALLTMVQSLAPGVGPAVGGFLRAWFGWRSIFVALVALGVVTLGGVWLALPETAAGSGRMLGSYLILLRSHAYRGYIARRRFYQHQLLRLSDGLAVHLHADAASPGDRGRALLTAGNERRSNRLRRGSGGSIHTTKARSTGKAQCVIRADQPDAREGQAGHAATAGTRRRGRWPRRWSIGPGVSKIPDQAHRISARHRAWPARHANDRAFEGCGWTETANIYTVVFDNSYVGYVCAFNSQGDVEIPLQATGDPGWHVIDLYPAIYRGDEQRPRNFLIP